MRYEEFIKKYLPKDKETFSRDFVEHLIKLSYEYNKVSIYRDLEEQRREDQYGPMFL